MHLGSTEIIDTFAEAFRVRYARVIVTAHDDYWLDAAVRAFSGDASSVIACDAEIGVVLAVPDTVLDESRLVGQGAA